MKSQIEPITEQPQLLFASEQYMAIETLIHGMHCEPPDPLFSHCTPLFDIWVHGIPGLIVMPIHVADIELDGEELSLRSIAIAELNWLEMNSVPC